MKKRRFYLPPHCDAIETHLENRLMTGSTEGAIHGYVFDGNPWENLTNNNLGDLL